MKFRALTLGLAVLASSFLCDAGIAQEDNKSKIEPISAESTTTQKTQETPAKEAKTAGQETGEKAKEGADKAQKAAGGADMAMKRQLANAESRYRVRSAKLAKLAAVAEEKGDADMAKRVAELQKKNDGKRATKIAQLREKYGDAKVDGALKKVDKIAGNRNAAAARVKEKAKTGKQLKEKSGDSVGAKNAKAKELKDASQKKDAAKQKGAGKLKGAGKPKKKDTTDS